MPKLTDIKVRFPVSEAIKINLSPRKGADLSAPVFMPGIGFLSDVRVIEPSKGNPSPTLTFTIDPTTEAGEYLTRSLADKLAGFALRLAPPKLGVSQRVMLGIEWADPSAEDAWLKRYKESNILGIF